MRRMFMLVGLSTLLITLAVGVAMAVTYKVRQCDSTPCNGTDGSDLMYERQGQVKDRIFGFDAKDRLVASTFNNDRDRLYGGRGNDVIFTNDGDSRDLADGGRGRNRCVADRGDQVRNCRRINPSSTEAAVLRKEVEQTGGP